MAKKTMYFFNDLGLTQGLVANGSIGTPGQALFSNGDIAYWDTITAASVAAAGANTQLQFNDSGVFGATANLTFDKTTNILYVNGNVGVGISNPTYKLHVNDTAASGAGLYVTGGGTGGPIARFERTVGSTGSYIDIIATSSDPQMRFIRTATAGFWSIGVDDGGIFKISNDYLGTNDRVTISATGNVGINTTNPTERLHVVGNYILLRNSADAAGGIVVDTGSTAAQNSQILLRDRNSDKWSIRKVSTNNFDIYSSTLASSVFTILDASGNVGIATTSPSTKLHVEGTSRVTANSQFYGRIYQGVSSYERSIGNAQEWGGGNSSLALNIQDGAGRVNFYWNSNGGTTPTQTVANEDAFRFTLTVEQPAFYFSGWEGSTSAAGSPITWSEIFRASIAENNPYFRGNLIPTGSGTTNYVAKFTSAGNIGNSLIFDNGTLVGVSTTTGNARLTVRGAGTTGTTHSFEAATSGGATRFIVSDDGLSRFYKSDNNESMRIGNDGNVGIGTTTPSQRLHVAGGNFLVNNNGSGDTNSGIRIVSPIATTHYNWMLAAQQNVGAAFEITPSTAVGGTTFSTPVAVFTQAGNVGVGYTAPQKVLDVNGTGIVASFGGVFSVGGFAGIHFGYSESGTPNDIYKKSALVFERTDAYGQGGNAGGKIHFLLNNTGSASASALSHSVMTIDSDSSGTVGSVRVGIGTTNPAQKLSIETGHITLTQGYGITWNNGDNFIKGISGYHLQFTTYDGVSAQQEVMRLTGGNPASGGARVGIGTTSPYNARLHVAGNTTSPDLSSAVVLNASAVLGNSDPEYGTYFATYGGGGGAIQQRRGGSAVYYDLYLQPHGGNVGVGTSSPQSKLHVAGEIRHTSSLRSQGATYSSVWMQFDEHQFGNSLILGAGGMTAIGAGESANVIKTNIAADIETLFLSSDNGGTSEAFRFVSNTQSGVWADRVDAMTILGGGNVGIGTITPSARLHVVHAAGTPVRITGTAASAGFTITTPGVQDFSVGVVGSNFAWNNGNNFGGTQVMTLTPSGTLGVGTTTPGSGYRLEALGTVAIQQQGSINTTTPGKTLYGLHFNGQVSADQATGITWNGGTTTTEAHAGIYVQGSGSYGTKMYFATTDQYAIGSKTRMMIDHAGNVGINTVSPGYLFDVNGDARFGGGTPGLSGRINAVSSGGTYISATYTTPTPNITTFMGSDSSNYGMVGTYSAHDFVIRSNNTARATFPSGGGGMTLSGSRPIQISTADGAIYTTANGGGWSMGTYYKGSSGTIRAGFGAFGTDDSLTYAWIGTAHTNAWMTFLGSGNVGIGTTSPATKLNIFIGDGGSNGTAGLRIGGTSNYESLELGIVGAYGAMFRSYGNDMHYYSGHWRTVGTGASEDHSHFWYTSKSGSANWSTAKMTFNHDGNLGIATTSPFSKLQVGSHTFSGGNGVYSNDRSGISVHGALTSIMYASTYNDSSYPDYGLVFVHGPNTGSYNVWSISPDGPAKGSGLHFIYGASATNIHAVTPKISFIGSSGNVGINTINPSTRLHVVTGNSAEGEVRIENSSVAHSSGINFYTAAAGQRGFVGWRGTSSTAPFNFSGMHLINFDNTPLILGTTNTERFRIDASGNTSIGTTSTTHKLRVEGTTRTQGLLRTNSRISNSERYPLGHYTPGETVFEIDPTWTQAELQEFFSTGTTSPTVEWVADSTAPGGYAISIVGNVNVGGFNDSGFPYIPVDQDDIFYMECWIRNVSGTNTHYMGSQDFNQDFTSLGGNPGSFGYWVMSNTNPGTSWVKVSGYISGFGTSTGQFASGTKYWTPQALFNYTGGGACYISGWKVIKTRMQGNRTFSGTVTSPTGRFQNNQTAGNYTTAALWTESYGNTATGIAFHISGNVGKFLEMRTNGILYWNGDTVWHSGNDGAGTSLDADLLDGQHGSYYAAASSLSSYMPLSGIPSGSDQYVNFRVIRNINAAATDGMYIGYGNAGGNAAPTRIYGGGSTGHNAYVDADGNIWRSNGGYQYVYNNGTWAINISGNAAGLSGGATINNANFNGTMQFPSGGGTGVSFANNHYSMGKDYANGSWSDPHYADLIIGYHTGIRIGAAYSGIRFYNNSPTTDANNDGNGDGGETLLMTVGGHAGGTGVLVNSLRSSEGFGTNSSGASTTNATTRVFAPGGASGSWNGTITGAIKIRLPFRANDSMWSFKVRIYNYSSNTIGEYHIGNYSYSAGAYNTACSYVGSDGLAAKNVRWGNEGGYDCVWIGETTDSWSYLIVAVTDIMVGYSNAVYNNFKSNWDISYVTSFGIVAETRMPGIRTNFVSVNSSMYSPIYYDSASPGYYCDPDSNSRFYGTMTNFTYFGTDTNKGYGQGYGTYSSSLHKIAYMSFDWDGNYNSYSNHGISSTDIAGSFADSMSINSYNDINFRLDSNANNGASYVRFHNDTAGTNQFAYIGYDGSNYTAWFNGILYGGSSVRSPIFYDYDNTGYYCDPASTSNFNSAYFQGGIGGISNSSSYTEAALEVRERNFGGAQDDTWATAPRIGFHWGGRVASQIAMNSSGVITILNNPGNALEAFKCGTFYSPIFYDNDNTAYYCNPGDRSRLSSIDYGNSGYYFGGGDWGWRHSTPYGWIQFGPANSSHAHIYTDRSNFYFNAQIQVNGGSQINTSDIRASIFYDIDNTGYYFGSGSGVAQASQLYADDWVRPQGGSGLYFQSYGYGLRAAGAEGNSYGNASTYGGGVNGWQGWSISSNVSFMGRGSTDIGIYSQGYGWILYGSYGGLVGIGTSTTSGSYRMYVDGAIYSTGNIVAYSDRRVKENIKPIDNALDKVEKMRGVTYNKINNEKTEIGFIAQELNEIIPEVVTYAEDVDQYGVAYPNITALLVEAIKELSKEVKILKQKLGEQNGIDS